MSMSRPRGVNERPYESEHRLNPFHGGRAEVQSKPYWRRLCIAQTATVKRPAGTRDRSPDQWRLGGDRFSACECGEEIDFGAISPAFEELAEYGCGHEDSCSYQTHRAPFGSSWRVGCEQLSTRAPRHHKSTVDRPGVERCCAAIRGYFRHAARACPRGPVRRSSAWSS